MSEIPKLSDKEALILGMLIAESKEMYGLEMIERSGGCLKLGTLYTTLNRMEDKGYIVSRKEAAQPNARGLPRRLYCPTGLGTRVHAAWEAAGRQWREGIV